MSNRFPVGAASFVQVCIAFADHSGEDDLDSKLNSWIFTYFAVDRASVFLLLLSIMTILRFKYA